MIQGLMAGRPATTPGTGMTAVVALTMLITGTGHLDAKRDRTVSTNIGYNIKRPVGRKAIWLREALHAQR
jgi:hypothetical protein